MTIRVSTLKNGEVRQRVMTIRHNTLLVSWYNGFLLDLYVFQALQELYDQDIELVTNSKYNLGAFNNNSVKAEFIEKIIIPGIPNYIGTSGPYHECMEELREANLLVYLHFFHLTTQLVHDFLRLR